MNEEIVKSVGLNLEPYDVVVLVTKDGISDEEIDALDPMMIELADSLGAMVVVFPETVFADIKTLHLQQLLSLREDIDEAIASKMSTTNVPTA